MTDRPTIVVPGDHPTQISGSRQLDRIDARANIVIHQDPPRDLEDQVRRAADADILLNSRGSVHWPAETLRKLPKLKMITTCSIGTDSIDIAAARERGIVVSNIPGRTRRVVAEHAICLILAITRRVVFHTTELRSGRWSDIDSLMCYGKRLGVVGTGPIGAETAKMAKALGMEISAWTFHPSPERAEQLGVSFVDLDELLRTSDVISLHLKLTADSARMFGAREFSLMKPGSFLVNTARGGLVDSDALVEALDSGQLGGAGLDVFEQEPLPVDSPILNCQHVVLTPHNADRTPEGTDLLNEGAIDNILAFLDGKPINVVTGP